MEPRFYESIFPRSGDITVILIREVNEMGVYAFLTEYGNINGLLLMSEISRRRIRSVSKLIKIGKTEIVLVIRVDYKKGYIDLSKRRTVEGENLCMEKKWTYSRIVDSIVTFVSKIKNFNNENCKIRWLWLLFREHSHAWRSFKKINKKNLKLLKNLDITTIEIEKLLEILKKKLPKTFEKAFSIFELTSFSPDGVLDIKNIISKTIQKIKIHGIKDNIFIKLSAPPSYNIIIRSETRRKTMKLMLKFYSLISLEKSKQKANLFIKYLTLI
jgi:translation initiation factor 2 subunit 1